ncbi:MAG: tryptophan-rich sensory protein [Ferruginibacter sp.]|nr:tryptophan-rich sensory protein [Ferruginibacter sp.]
MKPIVKLIISVAIPLIVGGVASFFTMSSVKTWFVTLNKPFFNPPSWLFAPVWTMLYILMGIACYLVWKSVAPQKIKRQALTIYGIQLLLNFLWSFIFFYAKQPGWAVADIVLLLAAIITCIVYFRKISASAAWLLVPYLCWVCFATALNTAIWQLN